MMRPPGPVGETACKLMPRSLAIFLARGLARSRSPLVGATATAVAFEPTGTSFPDGATLTLPNDFGLAPGSLLDVYRTSLTTGAFERIGQAQVSQNNLFGRGQTLSLQAQVSSIRRLFTLSFFEPMVRRLFEAPRQTLYTGMTERQAAGHS